MKILIHAVEEGDKGVVPYEVLLMDGGHETKIGDLVDVDQSYEIDVGHPEAIVVRPLQA